MCVLQEDLLSVWNRSATDYHCTNRIRDTLRRILNLPPNTPMEYKTHCDSLKYTKVIGGTSNAGANSNTSNTIMSGSDGGTPTPLNTSSSAVNVTMATVTSNS